ncbi:MAG: hypothetical protein V2J55_21740, partial [Candidatus Competibacteraceae bacterium]|nr:hypothetical protein [Candidatus Competibacteraceae bacterium]
MMMVQWSLVRGKLHIGETEVLQHHGQRGICVFFFGQMGLMAGLAYRVLSSTGLNMASEPRFRKMQRRASSGFTAKGLQFLEQQRCAPLTHLQKKDTSMRSRPSYPSLLAAATLLILVSPLLLAEFDKPDKLPAESVTVKKLEAKVAETEGTSGLEDEVKIRLLDFYRKALDNLKTAASDIQAAAEYTRLMEEAPFRITTQRDATVDLQSQAADTLDV